jgi:hypothetical protein
LHLVLSIMKKSCSGLFWSTWDINHLRASTLHTLLNCSSLRSSLGHQIDCHGMAVHVFEWPFLSSLKLSHNIHVIYLLHIITWTLYHLISSQEEWLHAVPEDILKATLFIELLLEYIVIIVLFYYCCWESLSVLNLS